MALDVVYCGQKCQSFVCHVVRLSECKDGVTLPVLSVSDNCLICTWRFILYVAFVALTNQVIGIFYGQSFREAVKT